MAMCTDRSTHVGAEAIQYFHNIQTTVETLEKQLRDREITSRARDILINQIAILNKDLSVLEQSITLEIDDPNPTPSESRDDLGQLLTTIPPLQERIDTIHALAISLICPSIEAAGGGGGRPRPIPRPRAGTPSPTTERGGTEDLSEAGKVALTKKAVTQLLTELQQIRTNIEAGLTAPVTQHIINEYERQLNELAKDKLCPDEIRPILEQIFILIWELQVLHNATQPLVSSPPPSRTPQDLRTAAAVDAPHRVEISQSGLVTKIYNLVLNMIATLTTARAERAPGPRIEGGQRPSHEELTVQELYSILSLMDGQTIAPDLLTYYLELYKKLTYSSKEEALFYEQIGLLLANFQSLQEGFERAMENQRSRETSWRSPPVQSLDRRITFLDVVNGSDEEQSQTNSDSPRSYSPPVAAASEPLEKLSVDEIKILLRTIALETRHCKDNEFTASLEKIRKIDPEIVQRINDLFEEKYPEFKGEFEKYRREWGDVLFQVHDEQK